jgi:hypothetical protein
LELLEAEILWRQQEDRLRLQYPIPQHKIDRFSRRSPVVASWSHSQSNSGRAPSISAGALRALACVIAGLLIGVLVLFFAE